MKIRSAITCMVLLFALTLLLVACVSSPVKISVLTEPDSLIILQGDTLDLTGGTVLVTYSDGTTKTVSMSELEVREINADIVGTQTAVLVYKEGDKAYSTTLTVRVEEPKIVRMEIDDTEVKKGYFEDDYFSTAGLIVTVYYENGTSGRISAYSVSPTKMKVDTESVRISIQGVYQDIAVQVERKAVVRSEIAVPLEKSEYFVQESFSPTGLIVNAILNNGATVKIDGDALTFKREDGTDYRYPQSVTDNVVYAHYTYAGVDCSLAVPIVVHMPQVTGLTIPNETITPHEYFEGETFSFTDMDITLHIEYENGMAEDTTPDSIRFDFSGEPLTLEDEQVEIWLKEYEEFRVSLPVIVRADTVESIEVDTLPTTLEYSVGDDISLAGLVLTATYLSGRTVTVTYDEAAEEITCEPMTAERDTTSVSVRYAGVETHYKVDVFSVTRTIDSLMLANPTELISEYAVGDVINIPNARFDVTFSDGDSIALEYAAAESVRLTLVTEEGAPTETVTADTLGVEITISFLASGVRYEGSAFLPITVV